MKPPEIDLVIACARTEQIMKKYKIGAQIYPKIPKRLLPQLNQMGIGYDNFLKDYLNYFDPFNLIFAMAAYDGFKAKIIKTAPNQMLHLGGHQTDELLNHPEKAKELINSILNL